MPSPIQSILVSNIDLLMRERSIDTLKTLSKATSINYNTLKSWMAYSYMPRLSSLDRLCDNLKIRTFMLFHPSPKFSPIEGLSENDSRESIRINLIKLLREKYHTSSVNKVLAELDGIISRDAYISYTRPRDGFCMPLRVLYEISQVLEIEPFKLLYRED